MVLFMMAPVLMQAIPALMSKTKGTQPAKNVVANAYEYDILVHTDADINRVRVSKGSANAKIGIPSMPQAGFPGINADGGGTWDRQYEFDVVNHEGFTTIRHGNYLSFRANTSYDTVYMTIFAEADEGYEKICECHPCYINGNFIVTAEGQLVEATEDSFLKKSNAWMDLDGVDHKPW